MLKRPRAQWLTNIVQIASGFQYTCARASDGSVWCWGTPYGQAEDVDHTHARPQRIQGIASAIDIDVADVGCAVTDDGKTQCWDANPFR